MADLRRIGRLGIALSLLGIAVVLLAHWMVFFWVPTEAAQGIVQRIFYMHVPAAWVTELAFGLTAAASCIYLWLRDDRADAAAVAAAEGGLYFCVILLIAGSLWGGVAWGTFWTWEPRLTLTLLLWFIFLGYFLVRRSTENPEKGKRFAAVVAIVGALDIPLIHMSVYWFRSLHPEPVVLRPEGPSADAEMVATLMVALVGYSLVFAGLFALRYGIERAEREWSFHSPHRASVVPARVPALPGGREMRWDFAFLVVAVAIGLLLTPVVAAAQDPALRASFRPFLFVLVAFAAGWVLIGAWVFQIGRKVSRLGTLPEPTGQGPRAGA